MLGDIHGCGFLEGMEIFRGEAQACLGEAGVPEGEGGA